MDNIQMAHLHRLRVINFDQNLSVQETNLKIEDNIKLNSEKLCQNDLNFPNNTKMKYQPENAKNKTTKPAKKKRNMLDKKINIRANSDLLHRNNIILSLNTKRTRSFVDIKNTLKKSIHSIKIRKRGVKNKKSNYDKTPTNKRQKKHMDSQDDIKVLYTFQRSKSQNRKRDLSPKCLSSLIRRSSSEIFGTGNIRKNRRLCYQTCRNSGLQTTPKNRKKSKPHEVYPFYTPFKNKELNQNNKSEQYNVVHVSKASNVNNSILSSHNFFRKEQEVVTQNVTVPDCKGDAGRKYINQSNLKDTFGSTIHPAAIYKHPRCNEHIKQEDSASTRLFTIFKCVVKYILLAISIVVWSPCIICAVPCWYILSPLKHQDLIDECKTEGKTSGKKKTVFDFISDWLARNTRHIVYTFKALSNENYATRCSPSYQQPSMPTAPCPVGSIRRKNKDSLKWQPNPEKTYVLTYDANRGWLMKPLQNYLCQNCHRNAVVSTKMNSKREKTVKFSGTAQETINTRCKCMNLPSNMNGDVARGIPCKNKDEISQEIHKKSYDDTKTSYLSPKRFKTITLRKTPSLGQICFNIPCNKPIEKQRIHIKNKSRKIQVPSLRSCHRRIPCIFRRIQGEPVKAYNRFCRTCKKCAHDVKCAVHSAEESYKSKIDCSSFQSKPIPYLWAYNCFPSMYSGVFSFHQVCSQVCHLCLFVLAGCVWCPVIFCCYILSYLLCSCFN